MELCGKWLSGMVCHIALLVLGTFFGERQQSGTTSKHHLLDFKCIWSAFASWISSFLFWAQTCFPAGVNDFLTWQLFCILSVCHPNRWTVEMLKLMCMKYSDASHCNSDLYWTSTRSSLILILFSFIQQGCIFLWMKPPYTYCKNFIYTYVYFLMWTYKHSFNWDI